MKQTGESLTLAAEALRNALEAASKGLVGRKSLVEMIFLCAVAGEHLLVIGPPGTAKSEAVRRVSKTLSGEYFEYLLGRFTEPSEIFGPVDLKRLRDGVMETQTRGMLPEAEIAFLDEVFLGSTAILNTLLTLLNERNFKRGHTNISCPLRVCVGASNALPTDHALEAFADRFLVQIFVQPVPDNSLERLLEAGWSGNTTPLTPIARIEHLDLLSQAARRADLSNVRSHLAQMVRTLRNEGIVLSDRRVVKMQKLIAAASLLAGRTTPTKADLWPVIFSIPSQKAQDTARDLLRDLLQTSENPTLPASALDASQGPQARAEVLLQTTETLLSQEPPDPPTRQAWLLKLEGAAREIDASFSATTLPKSLTDLRQRLVSILAPPQ